MFPSEGYFFLKCQRTGLVLDINGKDEAGSKLVVRQKGVEESDMDNQLWTFEKGYLVSKKTLLVVDIEGGDLRSDKRLLQYDRKKTMAHNQRFGIRDGFIFPLADPRLVLNTKDDEGSEVTVTYRKPEEANDLQQWYLEPFEGDY